MDLAIKYNDLLIDSATNDITTADNDADVLLSQIIESFDMTPADDIDFPEIYSLQRLSMNSDEKTDELRRIQDAKRIISQFREIDTDSIDAKFTDGKLSISFKTKNGISLEVNR